MALLDVANLSVAFQQDAPVVKGISFSIEAGEILALVGESGSGKSVTALSVLSLLGDSAQVSGHIQLDGEPILKQSQALLQGLRGDKVSMIFQEPLSSLNPLHTVEKQVSEILQWHRGLSQSQARVRVLELLDMVGIVKPESRLGAYPHELSGGQRQRVMIAMALANEPKLLIADEPTTALDVTIQKQILDLLKTLQAKLGMAILLISHDLNVVRHYADKVAVMRHGELLEQQNCQCLFKQPQHAYTQALLDAEPKRGDLTKAGDVTLLQAKKIKVWFPLKKGFLQRTYDNIKAVDEVCLYLKQGETLGIVGESGSGKSTLAQAVLRLIDSEGEICYQQQDLHALSQQQLRPIRQHLQIVFQDPFSSLSPRMSVEQIIGEGLALHENLTPLQIQQRVLSALDDVGLESSAASRYPHEFSGGQRQRIALARALVLKPKVLVLDEPTSALDRSVQKQLLDLLLQLQQKYNLSYLFISHDLAVIRALSHRVMVMQHGKVVEQNETEQLFLQPQQQYTRGLINAALI